MDIEFYISDNVNSWINTENGEVLISVDNGAYDESVKFKFCPYTGEKITSIIERHKKKEIKRAEDEMKRLKESIRVRNELAKEREIAQEKHYNQRINEIESLGNYYLYNVNGKDYKVLSKKHLKRLLSDEGINLSNEALKRIKGGLYQNGKFVESTIVKIVESKQKIIEKKIVESQRNNKDRYLINKSAKNGESINCACCNGAFVKIQYSQAFCKNKCKVDYWNAVK